MSLLKRHSELAQIFNFDNGFNKRKFLYSSVTCNGEFFVILRNLKKKNSTKNIE